MVAELAGISASIIEQKSAGSKKPARPRWIQTATREPVYSVLDSNSFSDSLSSAVLPNGRDNVVVISAVPSGKAREFSEPGELSPYAWLPNHARSESTDARLKVEEPEAEEAIYSVVNKVKKPTTKIRQREPEFVDRQRELNKWLQTASQRPGVKGSSVEEDSAMYEAGNDAKFDNYDWQRGRGRPVVIPRGVVGLVGPYRVYPNPNERREYILREEELIEDVVDSVSEVAAGEDTSIRMEPHQRAKWKIREDDEETLVPELPDPKNWKGPSLDSGKADDDDEVYDDEYSDSSRSKDRNVSEIATTVPGRENWKLRESDPNSNDSMIVPGKQERAVDVPDDASTAAPVKVQSVSNEHQDKDSLNETGSTGGGAVEGTPGGNPSGGGGGIRDGVPAHSASSVSPPPRSLVSRILAHARSSNDPLDHAEPFSQLWVVLSNVYGELVVVLMLAFCLAEVMDTPVPLHSLQGVFLMYLYVGSIAVIISIYLWVLIDSCSSMGNGTRTDDAELGGASLTRFGSLKRAHISRTRTAPTSFYIRVGALLFGLATLVFNGLEMAMHSMMQGEKCHNEIVFVHPVLHGLFTFLQMHFLFVNSQVLVERFGLAARFGFTHLAATNIAVWARLVIWDSAQEWTYLVHLAQQGPETETSPLNLRGFPGSITRHVRDLLGETLPNDAILNPYQPISDEQISQVVDLHDCLNTNALGRLWTSSVPFLYPFIVQFSLIAAAVTYVMGQNVGRNRLSHKQKFHPSKDLTVHTRVGCDGSSKGLFLGILCMVAGIVVIIIFLVVKDDKNFPAETLSWLTCGTPIGILTLSGLMTTSGLVQVRQMSVVSRSTATLDSLLSTASLCGVQLYSVFTMVVAASSLATMDEKSEEFRARHISLLVVSVLQLVQCCAQSTLIAEASGRACITRFQMTSKPARQVVTFLLFSNAVLWAFDTVVTQSWLSQELQLRFFGVLAWGVISRIGLPLLVFYRFHSCVLLLEAWNKCYRMPRGEHPLN